MKLVKYSLCIFLIASSLTLQGAAEHKQKTGWNIINIAARAVHVIAAAASLGSRYYTYLSSQQQMTQHNLGLAISNGDVIAAQKLVKQGALKYPVKNPIYDGVDFLNFLEMRVGFYPLQTSKQLLQLLLDGGINPYEKLPRSQKTFLETIHTRKFLLNNDTSRIKQLQDDTALVRQTLTDTIRRTEIKKSLMPIPNFPIAVIGLCVDYAQE